MTRALLGEQTAAAFANHLFAGPWGAPELERQEGYARDHFHILLNRPSPPPEVPGNVWRALERATWHLWHTFTLLQRANGGE